MRQLPILLLAVAITLSGCNHNTTNDYPHSDAVYLNLVKTYILNEDGRIVKQTQKEQKLLTYRAFHSLYGDTRIAYNPAFQKLTVNESYTIMADGTKVPTPENGYNEVLPGFASESEAYNHLREMVVTHTALERGAVINCTYEVVTEAGGMPFLYGHELLSETCPIEELQIVIKVPTGTGLNYELIHANAEPDVEESKGFDIYTWQFNDLPQHLHEKLEPDYPPQVPLLLFSTQKNQADAMKSLNVEALNDQEVSPGAAEYVANAVKEKKSLHEKALEVQRLVVNDINLLPIPPGLLAFKWRPATQTWASNSGTPMEKAVLMASLLRAIDIDAEVCLDYPTIFENESGAFFMDATPFVQSMTEPQRPMQLSVTHLNANSREFGKHGSSVLSLNTGRLSKALAYIKGEIQITGDLTLKETGTLAADLEGQYSNAYNPWFKIMRDASTSDLNPGLKEEIKTSSPQQSSILFTGQKEKWAENRGAYCFVTLPQSSYGIASKGILPLTPDREMPVSFGYPLLETYQMTLTVPEGWELINDALTRDISSPAGNLSIRIEPSGNQVSIFKQIKVTQPEIDLTNYQVFKDLINTWHLKKYNQLVFRRMN